jgi:hypothetical protein
LHPVRSIDSLGTSRLGLPPGGVVHKQAMTPAATAPAVASSAAPDDAEAGEEDGLLRRPPHTDGGQAKAHRRSRCQPGHQSVSPKAVLGIVLVVTMVVCLHYFRWAAV